MRLGIVGCGFISQCHVIALTQVRGWEITGLYSKEGAPRLSHLVQQNALGPAVVYESVSELAEHVDVIAIYAPNDSRLAIVEEIAESVRRGARLRGLICEKPLGRNLSEARRLVELATKMGVPTAYFENQLFMKPLQSQLRQLEPLQREMGPLSLVRTSEEHGGPHSAWFWDPVLQGGGVLNDMGCHSIAAGWYTLTPVGKDLTFLVPQSVSADVGLLKWGQPRFRERLLREKGVDYSKTPAEDFATGIITFRNPLTNQRVKAQFTNSWMFEKQGLRIFSEGLGPGYAFEFNSQTSPATIFIADEAAEAIANRESTMEKATASRGLLAVQYNEADLYGYVDENRDALDAFERGSDAMLPWSYGLEVTRLVLAAYLAAERKSTVDLTDPQICRELETYIPAIAQGKGSDLLYD